LLAGKPTARNEDEIVTGAKIRVEVTDGFAQPPLDQIPPHRAADPSANRESVPVMPLVIREYRKDQ
jgi:hypothetical protein